MKPEPNRPAARRRRGCLVVLLLGVGFLAFSFYQAFEQDRRAVRVHQSIHPGMSVAEVEGLLTGRYFCSYRMKQGADWEDVSRDEFLAASEAPEGVPTVPRQIHLAFVGISPRHLLFDVEIDGRGLVSGVTDISVMD